MALLEFYGMFDYVDGDTDVYEYTAAEWSKFIQAITNNGVTTGAFAATANGLQITVGGGTAFIQGRYGYSDNAMYLALQPEAPSLQRIDRIVAELNVRNRTMEIKVVQGEAAAESSVAPPALERSENVYQIPLWQALIRSGSTVTLTDERSITFTPTEVAAQFRELQAEFEKIKAGETTVYAVYA